MTSVRWIFEQTSAGFSERKVKCTDDNMEFDGTECHCECTEQGYYWDYYLSECRQCSPGCMDCSSNCACDFCYDGWEHTPEGKCACSKEDYEVDEITGECVPSKDSVICDFDEYEIENDCEPCNA